MQSDMFESKIESAKDAVRFIYGGSALFTIVSTATGKRFTFKVRGPHKVGQKTAMRFVRVLSGPDNTSSYTYIGYLHAQSKGVVNSGKAGKPESPGYKALNWTLAQLVKGKMPDGLEFYHAGKCGACGRTLTVPESIRTGLGPVCAGKM